MKFFYALSALLFCLPLATAEAAPIDDLCAAAQWVNVEDARSAVVAGADVNERGCIAMSTPLHRAAWAGAHSADALSVAMLLVEEGANLEARQSGGRTPLHLAAINTRRAGARIVDYLIAQGANANAQDDDGSTPLLAGLASAASTGSRNRAAFRSLLAATNLNLADNRGRAPLHVAVSFDDTVYVPGGSIMTNDSHFYINALLTAGANPNIADNNGRTPLHNAAQWGSPGVVRLLLNAGASVHAQTSQGETALDLTNDNSVSLALLNRGACESPLRWDANAGECAIPPAPSGGSGGGGGGGMGVIAAGAVLMLGAAWVFTGDSDAFSFAPQAFYEAGDGAEFSGYGGRLDWRGDYGNLFWEFRRDNPDGAGKSRLDWEYGGALNLWRGMQVDGAIYAAPDSHSHSDDSDIAEWRAGMAWDMEWDANHFVFRADKTSERAMIPWRMEWSAAPLFSRFWLRPRFYAAGENAIHPGAGLRAGADAEMRF